MIHLDYHDLIEISSGRLSVQKLTEMFLTPETTYWINKGRCQFENELRIQMDLLEADRITREIH